MFIPIAFPIATTDWRLGLAAGVHATKEDTVLGSEQVDSLAPLPTLGIRAVQTLSPALLARADADCYVLS